MKEISQPKVEQPDNSIKTEKQLKSVKKESPFAVLLFYLIIGIIIVWSSQGVRDFLAANYLPIAIIGGILFIAILISYIRSGDNAVSVKRRIAVINYGAIPILLILAVAIYVLPQHHVIILRSFFLLIVCLLPATLYYLFIASSKSSLLYEYFTMLSRLGLLKRQSNPNEENDAESELDRRVRVMSYIEKFESVYGYIPDDLADEILDSTDPDNHEVKVPSFHKYSTEKMLGGIFTPETTIPVVIATLLIGLGWLLTLPPWDIEQIQTAGVTQPDFMNILNPVKYSVNFAFLGAYFFSLQMLFRRYLRKDLRGNAYTAVSLRIILAVIGIWAVTQALPILDYFSIIDGSNSSGYTGNESPMLLIAFVIGAFPPLVWQIIQSAFKKMTGAKYFVPSLRSQMPVNELDGLTVWHEARLEEEDIENVPNMATADIVELLLHTRIPRERIIDWVDQALLYMVIGPEKRTSNGQENEDVNEENASNTTYRSILRRQGIRTASDLIVAYNKSKSDNDIQAFLEILPKEGRYCIQSLVDVLSTYPNVNVILRWRLLNFNNGPQISHKKSPKISSQIENQSG